MKSYVWQFQDKRTSREAFYGNLRELCRNEVLTINGRIKKEENIRYLLRDTNKCSDEKYLIKKVEVKRTKIK
mgnify:CR=1 FL=1